MPDIVTVTTSESWFSRLGKSVAGVLVGLALTCAAFPLLWWNEGRAVHRARSLAEGAAIVVDVPAGSVDPANDGRLVHVSGLATTGETLSDPDLGISARALRLVRVAQTYQWKESSSKRTRKKLGGGEETTTTYRYEKTWASERIDSSRFHERSGHENPPALRWESKTATAGQVTLGAFTLSPELVSKISRREPRESQPSDAALMSSRGFRAVEAGTYYLGRDQSAPDVGDVRVRFEVSLPTTVSVVAVQRGAAFEAYHARAGSDILLLEENAVPAEQMFKSARTSNTILTWVLRGVGFLVMFIGLVMIVRPLSVLASVVPFLGSLVGAGTGLVAFLLALGLSLVTIALAWVFYRPLVGVSLLVAAGAAFYLLLRRRRKGVAVPPPVPPSAPPPLPPPIPRG